MSWLRLHAEVVDNPKAQKLTGELFKTWVNCLCLSSRTDGILPSISDLSFRLRISAKETERRRHLLVSEGLIDQNEETFRMHDWNDWQYVSDNSSSRVKRFRERKGNTPEPLHETTLKRPPAVTVTPPEQNRTDTDSETEQSRAELPLPPLSDPPQNFWRSDETYLPFVQEYWATGKSLLWEDFVDAWWPWSKLDFSQKQECVKAMRERVQEGAWSDPVYIPNPRKFIEKEYKRPISIPQPRTGGNSNFRNAR